jgi:hypothetical protein
MRWQNAIPNRGNHAAQTRRDTKATFMRIDP